MKLGFYFGATPQAGNETVVSAVVLVEWNQLTFTLVSCASVSQVSGLAFRLVFALLPSSNGSCFKTDHKAPLPSRPAPLPLFTVWGENLHQYYIHWVTSVFRPLHLSQPPLLLALCSTESRSVAPSTVLSAFWREVCAKLSPSLTKGKSGCWLFCLFFVSLVFLSVADCQRQLCVAKWTISRFSTALEKLCLNLCCLDQF